MTRFWDKVEGQDCWVCTASTRNGYGQWRIPRKLGNKVVYAHLYAYETLVGPIPEGYDIDHLCRNRACCNPGHMEPVTRSENMLRSPELGKGNLKKTHCPREHPLSGANLYVYPDGRRSCRECMRAATRKWRAKR